MNPAKRKLSVQSLQSPNDPSPKKAPLKTPKSVRFADQPSGSSTSPPPDGANSFGCRSVPEVNKLPVKVLSRICSKLDMITRARMKRVCKRWNEVITNVSLTGSLIDLSQLVRLWSIKNGFKRGYPFFHIFGPTFIHINTMKIVIFDSGPRLQHCGDTHRGSGAEKEQLLMSLWQEVCVPLCQVTILIDGIFMEWESLGRFVEMRPFKRLILKDLYVMKLPSCAKDIGAPPVSVQIDHAVIEFPRLKDGNVRRTLLNAVEKHAKPLTDSEIEQLATAISVTWNEEERKTMAAIIKSREGLELMFDMPIKTFKVITQRELLPFLYRMSPHLKPKPKDPCLFIRGRPQR